MCWKEYPRGPTPCEQTLFCKPGCHAPACWTSLMPVQSAFYQNDCGENPKSTEIPKKKVARPVLIILLCLVFWELGKVYTNDSRYLIRSMANPIKKFSAFFPFQGREENSFSIQGIPLAWLLLNLFNFFRWQRDRHMAARSTPSTAGGHLWWHKKKLFYLVYTCIFFLNFSLFFWNKSPWYC